MFPFSAITRLEIRVSELWKDFQKEKLAKEDAERYIKLLEENNSLLRGIRKARCILVGECPTCGHTEHQTIAEAEALAKSGDVITLLTTTLNQGG